MSKKQTHLQKRVAETMTVKKLDVFRSLVLFLVIGFAVGMLVGYFVFS